MSTEGSFLSNSPLSPLRYRSVQWINNMRLRYDALTWQWQSWIVGYNSETQYDLLQTWFGEISGRKFAMVLLGSWALVLMPVGVLLIMRRKIKPVTPLDKYYLAFCNKLEKAGVKRSIGETPANYCERAVQQFPSLAAEVSKISAMYCLLAYENSGGADFKTMREFKQSVRRLRPHRR